MMTFVVHFVLHDPEHCLVWANISCIKILENLIMVSSVFFFFNMCTIVAFVDVFEDVFDTFHSGANFYIQLNFMRKLGLQGTTQESLTK